jgi:hypothetical protein
MKFTNLRNSEGVASRRRSPITNRSNSFRVATKEGTPFYTQGFKANPGLEFANTFGVGGEARMLLP